eukprot:TRINITY_DN12893_c0_g1_i2.p2 TRINITY_DN12893_c0_g1~~TRINITY_DN12893_c0_g1_i2.p2  ORF type:complete len:190 (-),score=48.62 TRINITY_DN12893_c0_g1_i2:7-576(-)
MADTDAPKIYDPWKCMKHPEAAEGTPQVFFFNEQTNGTEWYRPLLHQFEPDDVAREELGDATEPGAHLLAAAGPYYMFTAHAEEQCIRQSRADGSRVRTVPVGAVPGLEEAGRVQMVAMSCGETGREVGEYAAAVVVRYTETIGGIAAPQTRLLRIVVRRGGGQGRGRSVCSPGRAPVALGAYPPGRLV